MDTRLSPAGKLGLAAWLNRGWRLLATGWCFIFIGVGGLVMALTILPAVRLWPAGSPHQRNARARRIVHHTFRFYLWQMEKLGAMTLVVEGREHLAATRGRLVIANHPSLLDVVILISLMPETDCVVKQALWSNPLLKGVVAATDYIDNTDGEAMLARCQASLAAGNPLIVFPEGTRSRPGQPLAFQRGAARIALHCQADYVPAIITCNPPTLLKGEPWYKIPARKPRFCVSIRQAQRLADAVDMHGAPSLAARQLTRHWQDDFEAALAISHKAARPS